MVDANDVKSYTDIFTYIYRSKSSFKLPEKALGFELILECETKKQQTHHVPAI